MTNTDRLTPAKLLLAACLAFTASAGISCSPLTAASDAPSRAHKAGSASLSALGASANVLNANAIVNFSPRNAVVDPASANPHGRPVIRFDTQGNAVDAHDGEIKYFEGRYYLYGTSYDCGFRWASHGRSVFCGFKSYSSTDLVHWKDEGLLFDPGPWQRQRGFHCADHGCFRPHVLKNPAGKYVLWVNTATGGVSYRVFVSDTPTGPFILQPLPSKLLRLLWGGDHGLFKDDDGTAYLIDTNYGTDLQPTVEGASSEAFKLVVEKLNPDYTDGTGQYVRLPADAKGEAPTMFKRAGRYYIVYDAGCAYCPGGRASYVSAPNPMGPWSLGGVVTDDSCGGQVAHVENLEGAYLFMSDLWYQNKPYTFDPPTLYGNQGRANYFWGTLSFRGDGGLEPVACVASLRPNPFLRFPGSQEQPPDLDQSSGVAGFSSACDIGVSGGKVQRLQTFKAGRSGILASVAFTAFQSGSIGGVASVNVVPDADLNVEILEMTAAGQIGTRVASFVIPRTSIGFSARKVTVSPRIAVRAGQDYGILVHAAISAASHGCYGFAYSDANPYPAGVQQVSTDGGRTFAIERNRALRFETTVIPMPSDATDR